MNYQSIGRLFRRTRRGAGMSQLDVAKSMGCSRAQVDNIEVARQRAPLHRLEDFAKAVGLKVIVQVTPRSARTARVRTTPEMIDVLDRVAELDETDRELVEQFARLLPHRPAQIRESLRGVVALWTERYASEKIQRSESA